MECSFCSDIVRSRIRFETVYMAYVERQQLLAAGVEGLVVEFGELLWDCCEDLISGCRSLLHTSDRLEVWMRQSVKSMVTQYQKVGRQR